MSTTTKTTKTKTWNWKDTTFGKDKSTILLEYPKRKTLEQVQEKLNHQFPEYPWDWTINETKRVVSVFKNHWRVKEEEDLARGKTQQQIWKEEAIGKCLRMAKMGRDGGWTHRNPDGTEDLTCGVESMKQCWIQNKIRWGGSEEDARAEVEKDFADYIAEYGEA